MSKKRILLTSDLYQHLKEQILDEIVAEFVAATAEGNAQEAYKAWIALNRELLYAATGERYPPQKVEAILNAREEAEAMLDTALQGALHDVCQTLFGADRPGFKTPQP
jgi:hypothetical protein